MSKKNCLNVLEKILLLQYQGPHCAGKMTKNIPLMENTENLEILPKHIILFVQVVNSLIPKVKGLSIFAPTFSKKKLEAGYICQVSFVYIIVTNHINWHKEHLR